MLGNALGTAAGIRLANKVEAKEQKKKEEKARKQKENAENYNKLMKEDALRRMKKDLATVVEDFETRAYLESELTDAFKYLNIDNSFYISTIRKEIFQVGSWGKLLPDSDVDISKVLQRVENKKRRLAKCTNEEVVAEVKSVKHNNVEEIHKDLLDNLSLAQYKELTKLLMDDLGWSTEVSHDSTASQS